MRITKSNPRSRVAPKSEWWLWSIILVLAFGLGLLVCQSGWGDTLRAFTDVLRRDPRLAVTAWFRRADVPALTIDLSFADYQRLYARREQAPNPAADVAPVPATITSEREAAGVALRLNDVAVTASREEHWSFEFTAGDGAVLFGIHAATLIPATEDALLSWGYLAMLRQEGFLVPHYRLVRLVVNGQSWGLYALEALPSAQMIAAQQGGADSAIAFFDVRDFLAAQPVLSGSSFAYARVQVVRAMGGSRVEWEAAMADDPVLVELRTDVVNALRAVETGAQVPSQVFDAEFLGRFLAVTTLWRGSPDLDWRTLRLAYDPATQQFAPIATGTVPDSSTTLPAAFTDDPAIQRAYAQALHDLSDPAVLARLEDEFGPELESLHLAVGADFNFPPSPWETLAEHQARMRQAIAPPRTLFVAVAEKGGDLLFTFTNVVPFPVEVVYLDIGERVSVPFDPAWVVITDRVELVDTPNVVLPARIADTPVAVEIRVPLSALPVELQGTPGELHIVTRIWGLEEEIAVSVEWGSE